MATQERWLCSGCGREWVHAIQWSEGMPCPACGCPETRKVQFSAAFPGGDIPRAGIVVTFGIDAATGDDRTVSQERQTPVALADGWDE